MNETIVKKVKALPPLDRTIMQIQAICLDENSSLLALVKVVESDPMLMANILKSANSPLYGFSREIKSISHAISLFGMSTIRGFALLSAIRNTIPMNLSPYTISNEDLLTFSTLQSALIAKWYAKVDTSMLDVLQPASFLMEVGKIIIANHLIESKQDGAFKEELSTINSLEALSLLEEKYVGFSNEEITAQVFEHWHLESELIASIRYSNNITQAPKEIEPYAKALHIAKTTINIFGQLDDDNVAKALSLVATHHLNPPSYLESIEFLKQ